MTTRNQGYQYVFLKARLHRPHYERLQISSAGLHSTREFVPYHEIIDLAYLLTIIAFIVLAMYWPPTYYEIP